MERRDGRRSEDRGPDFIGLGAQKAGTSWIYACLYEHPQICAPVKEHHFFSRDQRWEKGYTWYEEQFSECPADQVSGEFSTSYLCHPHAVERIAARYPHAKLLVSLRDPVERALSNYRNDLMAGRVEPDLPFEEAVERHPEYVEQGLYAEQLERVYRYVDRANVLVLIYEESIADPAAFIGQIYEFLGVDPTFHPTMLNERVNVGRPPRHLWLERVVRSVSAGLRRGGLRRLWWLGKRAGFADRIRQWNAAPTRRLEQRDRLRGHFAASNRQLESMLGRPLTEWEWQ